MKGSERNDHPTETTVDYRLRKKTVHMLLIYTYISLITMIRYINNNEYTVYTIHYRLIT